MSTSKNAKRVNLSFRSSSKDQCLAYETLCDVENKTEYVTRLILADIGRKPEERVYTQNDVNQMLMDTLPTLVEKYLAENMPKVTAPVQAPVEERQPEKPRMDAETEGLLLNALAGFGNF